MEIYEQLLQDSDNVGLNIIENVPFKSNAKGFIYGNCIALSDQLETHNEKACVLAEEMGHHYTCAGNIIDLSMERNRKLERTGRLWAYDKLLGLSGIVRGYHAKCRNRYELAECLNVTEKFLQEALDCYKEKYGLMAEIDGYTIIFEPSLAVIEKV